MSVEEINTAKEIITVLAKQMDRLTGLKTIMVSDDCVANKAYKKIEDAIYDISDAIGIGIIEMEELMDTRD